MGLKVYRQSTFMTRALHTHCTMDVHKCGNLLFYAPHVRACVRADFIVQKVKRDLINNKKVPEEGRIDQTDQKIAAEYGIRTHDPHQSK